MSVKTKRAIFCCAALAALLGAGLWNHYQLIDRTEKLKVATHLMPSVETGVHAKPVSTNNVNTTLFSTTALSSDEIYQVIDQLKLRNKTLTTEECRILFEFLGLSYPDIPPQRLAGIKNEVLHILRGQPNLPAPWDQMLASLFQDRGQAGVVRDYALQHLFTWYEEMPGGAKNLGGEKALGRMTGIFWQALKESDSEIAGTALLGLCYLTEQKLFSDRERLSMDALAIVQNDRASVQSRLTALQVCARLGLKEAVPIALELAQGAKSLPIRCSAIAALGSLGGETELATLKSMIKGSNADLELAIARAIDQLMLSKKGLGL